MIEGVANSQTLAGVHFSDNRASHWLRIQIFFALTRAGEGNPLKSVHREANHGLDGPVEGGQDSNREGPVDSVFAGGESMEQFTSVILTEEEKLMSSIYSDLTVNEQRGNNVLANHRHKGDFMDKFLDSGETDQELLVKNIEEMFKANMTVISFPQSQNIINVEVLKQVKTD